jgi:DNA polymerase III subunit chi
MTRIDFYTHVKDKLATTCALSAKAVGRGHRVMILTPDAEVTATLDRLMWTMPALSFLPHCRPSDSCAEWTPVLIDHSAEQLLHDDLLINLQSEFPPCFSRFRRLLEIVGLEPVDLSAARTRYRFYRDRGYPILDHKLCGPP